jgi:hypothetical protein
MGDPIFSRVNKDSGLPMQIAIPQKQKVYSFKPPSIGPGKFLTQDPTDPESKDTTPQKILWA